MLYFGDNLEILREKFPENEVGYFDLIYLDPPFNSKKDYNIIFKEGAEDSPAQIRAFEDSWKWNHPETQMTFEELTGVRESKTQISGTVIDMMTGFEKIIGHNGLLAYLTMMTIRLIELRRVLKPTGSIYLHCDQTASHYLRIILDTIFGINNFRNEIIWGYKAPSASKKDFPRKHDTIFRYSKTDSYKFYPDEIRIPYSESFLKRRAYSEGKAGIFKQKGKHTDKEYSEGKLPADWWDDIPSGGQISSTERLGYPTQKPEKLLERIINASSKKDDWVLDPFCGCGTTLAVAENLNRKWVGIDITSLAINLIKHRIEKQYPSIKIETDGLPKDIHGAKALFHKDPFEFQYWALDLVDGIPLKEKHKKGGDKGIDGFIIYRDTDERNNPINKKVIVSVKGGETVTPSFIRDLNGTITREKAVAGLLITLEDPTRGMKAEANEAGFFKRILTGEEFPKLQICTIEDLLKGKRPELPSGLELAKPYKEAQKAKKRAMHGQAILSYE